MSSDAGRSRTCEGCGDQVDDDPEIGVVTWQGRTYCSVECSVSHERRHFWEGYGLGDGVGTWRCLHCSEVCDREEPCGRHGACAGREQMPEQCCPMDLNANGDGPEMDPAKIASTVCMDHWWESWPCRYDGTGWTIHAQTGEHDDGRPWQAWHVYLYGEPVFVSPSRELAEQGIEEWARSGHGPVVPMTAGREQTPGFRCVYGSTERIEGCCADCGHDFAGRGLTLTDNGAARATPSVSGRYWTLDPTDPTVAILASGTDSTFGVAVGPVTLRNVHLADRCAGRPCVIHAPSDHHMRDWPMHWRDDRGMTERLCPHGVGHPDPDDIGEGTHGCDGCCRSPR